MLIWVINSDVYGGIFLFSKALEEQRTYWACQRNDRLWQKGLVLCTIQIILSKFFTDVCEDLELPFCHKIRVISHVGDDEVLKY